MANLENRNWDPWKIFSLNNFVMEDATEKSFNICRRYCFKLPSFVSLLPLSFYYYLLQDS